ncbi:unnamed protein product, partial [Ectocarpus sp. 4 AP-2014]
VQVDEPYERKLNEICAHGCFNDEGVVDLNMRAEAVLFELDVPVVAGYDITHGQSWATATRDGRWNIPGRESSVFIACPCLKPS